MTTDACAALGRNIALVDDKHVSIEVRRMAWSPKMDLLALSNANHEVLLYRLTWQKVWSVSPSSEDTAVVDLAWRPDGKVLAIAYSHGQVALHGVEQAELQHVHITCGSPAPGAMSWLITADDARTTVDTTGVGCSASSPIFVERCHEFLPVLPAINKDGEEEQESIKRAPNDAELNLLVVGCEGGIIYIYALGLLCIANIRLSDYGIENRSIVSTCLSTDLSILSVVTASSSGDHPNKENLSLVTFAVPLLASRHHELKILAGKFVSMSALFEYGNAVIKQMQESWEEILLELDVKLMRLAEQKQAEGTSSMMHDLLELLMFGLPSDELQNFLLHDLTEKGLKKLGISIDNYYSTMQKLIVRNMQSALDGILYHLIDLRGMAAWYDRFGVAGLSLPSVKTAIASVGSLLLKASELSQVVDTSAKSLRAFFKWLYITIVRLSEETAPPEMSRLVMQDFSFVAEFIKENFMEADQVGGKQRPGFKLEKVGQYLKEEDIHVFPSLHQTEFFAEGQGHASTKNPWLATVQAGLLKDSELLFTPQPAKSLVKLFREAMTAINETFTNPAAVIGKSLEGGDSVRLLGLSTRNERPSVLQFTAKADAATDLCCVYTLFASSSGVSSPNHINIVKQTVSSGRTVDFRFGSGTFGTLSEVICKHCGQGGLAVTDMRHCSDTTIALLLSSRCLDSFDAGSATSRHTAVCAPQGDSALVILSLDAICSDKPDHFYQTFSSTGGCDISGRSAQPATFDIGMCVQLDNVRVIDSARQIAVSGQRKVASALLSNGRRVRLFMLDAADENDDYADGDDDEVTSRNVTASDAGTSVLDKSELDDKENSHVR